MAANPALVQTGNGEMMPAPFPSEVFILRRPGCGFEVDGVRTRSGKWSSKGTVYLSDIRMVFLADKADESGLAGFDVPLVYVSADKLNQPIFGCNNLAGKVWPAAEGGGPAGTLAPHDWKVLFKSGGIGTLYPLYYALAAGAPPGATEAELSKMANTAFVDPNDPSTVYLTQPVGDEQRLKEQPKYAANFGADEKYAPM
ncbi:MAG: hypothetical protein J3K34DRAFT_464442 [Monoraphidium minutum]|nr:MAG: hypothetical protein J3K34DRAFT_464442 [Monoraphidium minutum]